jgi:hypothetical protein
MNGRLILILTQKQSEELQSYLVEKVVTLAGSVGKTYLFLTKIEFDSDEESFTVHYKKELGINPSILRKDSGSNEYGILLDWLKPHIRDYKIEQIVKDIRLI